MKLNNKGFAISAVIYSLMFLFLFLIFATLGLLGSRKVVLDKYKKTVAQDLEDNTGLANSYKIDRSGASKPVLGNSMIPVIYDGTNWVKANFLSEYDQNWYNYEQKNWANAVVVKSSKVNTYNSTTPGTTINSADILGYYVWIPRFRYKIPSSAAVQLFEIEFEGKDTPRSLGSTSGEYLSHPAFSFGSTQISGFWIAKFETTGSTTEMTSLPNLEPIRDITVSDMYSLSKNPGTSYNLGSSDLHMLKNSEWSATTYLTTSIYGQGTTEVRKNSYNKNSGFKTGCGSSTASNAPRTADCEMGFGTSTTYPQSTTGNITGVFDMSGGAWEYVMAVMVGSDGIPQIGDSGFTSLPEGKYYDLYPYGTDINDSSRGTYASSTKETWGWFSDRTYLVANDTSWQFRGGCHNDQDDVGIFAFSSKSGEADGSIGFRTSIIVN